jgi:citrate synthase
MAALIEVPSGLEGVVALFSCARVGGWAAHILEQKRVGRLIWPSARDVGPGARAVESVAVAMPA